MRYAYASFLEKIRLFSVPVAGAGIALWQLSGRSGILPIVIADICLFVASSAWWGHYFRTISSRFGAMMGGVVGLVFGLVVSVVHLAVTGIVSH